MTADSISAAEYQQLQAKNMTEAQLQATIVGAAHRLGWLVYHTRTSIGSAPGYPDLHLVHPSRRVSLFRELKRETGKITPAQQEWLDALTAAGHDAGVWRPIDWFNRTIDAQLFPADEGIR